MDNYELARLINNLIRLGTVAEVRYSPASVRVKTGELTTNWVPVMTARAGDVRTWCPPSVGEQVLLLSPGGDLTAAVALTGVYSDSHSEPGSNGDTHITHYPDGAVVQYNHASGEMSVKGIQKLVIEASNEVDVTAGSKTKINSPVVEINGMLSLTGGSATMTVGEMHIKGTVKQTNGQLSSNGVVLDSHIHSGVQSGGGTTGGPQ